MGGHEAFGCPRNAPPSRFADHLRAVAAMTVICVLHRIALTLWLFHPDKWEL